MIGSYKFNSGDSYKITYNGNTYDLKLDKIGSAGHNIFKSAAFINFSKNQIFYLCFYFILLSTPFLGNFSVQEKPIQAKLLL